MIDPLPCRCMWGITYLQHRYTEVKLTCWTRCQASRVVVRIESSSGGEMPALWNAMSTRPCWATTVSYSRWTSSSLATSAARNSPPTAAAAALPAASSMSTATTRAPSAASLRALARPIPLPAPVMTATRSCNRCCIKTSLLCRDEDVLGLGERVRRVRAELAAQAGLLEPAERRPVPHRGVRVHRQVAGLHAARHPDGATH